MTFFSGSRSAVAFFFICVFVFALIPWCASGQASVQPAAPGVTRDITYTASGVPAEQGDLYLPAGAGPFPVILYLHGGSWRSGNRKEFSKLATDLAERGYAGFSVSYDLGAHSFPSSWNESRAALAFLHAHAAEYRLDPARIVVAGTSAGGELAALLALAPEGPAGVAAGPSLPVDGAIVLNGVFDLHADVHVITRYLGGRCETVEKTCEDASPEYHIHPGAPPFFVGHGTSDRVVKYGEAQRFIANLQKAGVPVTSFSAEGGAHMYWEKKRFYADDLQAIESFLAKTLPAK